MTRTLIAGLLLCSSAALAQGRGRRGGGPVAAGPTCVDMDQVDRIEIIKGASAVATYGPIAKNGLLIIAPKEGVTTAAILGACPGSASPPVPDPFTANLFSPMDVMSRQQALGLTEEQKQFIQQRMGAAQQTMAETDGKLRGEMETLNNLLGAKSVDETKVLETVDRVLALERQIKRAQVDLMVSVKNKLTEQQQAQLNALRGGE